MKKPIGPFSHLPYDIFRLIGAFLYPLVDDVWDNRYEPDFFNFLWAIRATKNGDQLLCDYAQIHRDDTNHDIVNQFFYVWHRMIISRNRKDIYSFETRLSLEKALFKTLACDRYIYRERFGEIARVHDHVGQWKKYSLWLVIFDSYAFTKGRWGGRSIIDIHPPMPLSNEDSCIQEYCLNEHMSYGAVPPKFWLLIPWGMLSLALLVTGIALTTVPERHICNNSTSPAHENCIGYNNKLYNLGVIHILLGTVGLPGLSGCVQLFINECLGEGAHGSPCWDLMAAIFPYFIFLYFLLYLPVNFFRTYVPAVFLMATSACGASGLNETLERLGQRMQTLPKFFKQNPGLFDFSEPEKNSREPIQQIQVHASPFGTDDECAF